MICNDVTCLYMKQVDKYMNSLLVYTLIFCKQIVQYAKRRFQIQIHDICKRKALFTGQIECSHANND